MTKPREILLFWFADADIEAVPAEQRSLWFKKDATFDRAVSDRFTAEIELALAGGLEAWCETPAGRLALIILLDQFPRNVFRDTPRAFAGDPLAQKVVADGLLQGDDQALPFYGRAFHYMPLMHAEERGAQARSVASFARLAQDADAQHREQAAIFHDFARQHQVIVDRFGRFPHRNAILGRPSTDEEKAFLTTPGSSF